jgi:hypothetical protein
MTWESELLKSQLAHAQNTQDQERRDMNTDNTRDASEPSPASAGSHNTHMATARLSAANTWLQDEIRRLRITAEEREAVEYVELLLKCESHPVCSRHVDTLRSMLRRLG